MTRATDQLRQGARRLQVAQWCPNKGRRRHVLLLDKPSASDGGFTSDDVPHADAVPGDCACPYSPAERFDRRSTSAVWAPVNQRVHRVSDHTLSASRAHRIASEIDRRYCTHLVASSAVASSSLRNSNASARSVVIELNLYGWLLQAAGTAEADRKEAEQRDTETKRTTSSLTR